MALKCHNRALDSHLLAEVRFRTLDPGSEVTLIKKVTAGAPADTKEDSK